ncbi:MAG TPA: hydrogenase accessory protein HypB, partial [Bacillota bacterium]|nr:hydrogenase accessory protein HypB [Bacillota bacterium]
MDDVRILNLKESVFADNDREAEKLREELTRRGVFLLNLMSAPGSGKTTLLVAIINKLKD